MIAFLRGKIAHKSPTHLILDNQGVGYHVAISLSTYEKIGDAEQIQLWIHHHFSDSVGQALYGFYTEDEKSVFQLLISVSGVGPNTAQVVLSSMDIGLIQQAVRSDDDAAFSKVKGIGPKTAKRIIIDLKDKLAKAEIEPAGQTTISTAGTNNTNRGMALSALLKLGYKKIPAQKALNKIMRESTNGSTVEDLIRKALATLS